MYQNVAALFCWRDYTDRPQQQKKSACRLSNMVNKKKKVAATHLFFFFFFASDHLNDTYNMHFYCTLHDVIRIWKGKTRNTKYSWPFELKFKQTYKQKDEMEWIKQKNCIHNVQMRIEKKHINSQLHKWTVYGPNK